MKEYMRRGKPQETEFLFDFFSCGADKKNRFSFFTNCPFWWFSRLEGAPKFYGTIVNVLKIDQKIQEQNEGKTKKIHNVCKFVIGTDICKVGLYTVG